MRDDDSTFVLRLRGPVPEILDIAGCSVLWLVIGITAGVVAATRRRNGTDRTITAIALGFCSMPASALASAATYSRRDPA